jgi:hypothetical protein
LTSGGIAPCLSASTGLLITEYTRLVPDMEIIGYLNGFKGLLTGSSILISEEVRKKRNAFRNTAEACLATAV